jgi:hypothetical protein
LPASSLSEAQKKDFEPRLKSLQLLIKQYDEAASTPSLSEGVRRRILDSVKTEEVKAKVLPILRDLFDGRQGQGQGQGDLNILNCILDGLTNDLPLTTLIPMVCRMYIKAFYNDSPFRMALGAVFVGSVSYVAWVGGMNQIVGLGKDSVILILSAMAQCAHITQDVLYSETLRNLLGQELFNGIGDAINYLLPSAGGIFAMSNVYLMGRIYGPGKFQAGDDLQNAEAARAAAAAGGGVAQQLQFGVLPANVPAPVPAPAVPHNNFVFWQMYNELRDAAVYVGTHAKNHLVSLLRLLRRIKTTRPGQEISEEERLSTIANVYATACVDNVFTVFNEQARTAGVSAVEVSAVNLLNACLPSEIRSGNELEAREEIFLLAHRIKSFVIDCLIATRMTREQATSLLEEAFPVFSSGLTEANVDRLNSGQLNTILRMILKAADTHNFLGSESSSSGKIEEEDWSQKAGPPYTPLQVRLASIRDDLMKLLHLDPSVPRTQDEETELINWVKANIGWLGSVIGIFDVSIGWVAKKARESKLLQCGVETVSGFAAEARHKMSAGVAANQADIFMKFPDLRQKLPDITLFLTAPWMHVLNEIKTNQATGESYDDIIDILCKRYRIEDISGFKAYIKALLLRVELEFIITRGGEISVQPNILVFTKKDGTSYEAPALTLSLPDGFYVGDDRVVVRTMDLKLEVFKDPVHLPGVVSELTKALDEKVQAAKKKSNELISVVTSVCSKKVPRFEVSVAAPPPLTIVPPPPQPMREDSSQEQEREQEQEQKQAEKQQAEKQQAEDQRHIAACCENAPKILGQLLEAQEVAGTIVAIQDAIDPNKEDKEAALALLKFDSRSRDPDLKEGGGGKSRTRRRHPSTAKRTRRKAYNKKSNKRKSSKQLSRKKISRRRQSRRK